MISAGGVMLAANVVKSSCGEPMIRFGGSPISVAVPPTFDARTSAIRYGTADADRGRE